MTNKKNFLVCYDYGTGGLWAYISARSPEEITNLYPELDVVDEVPPWLTDEDVENLMSRVIDIDGMPHGILNALLEDRRRQ